MRLGESKDDYKKVSVTREKENEESYPFEVIIAYTLGIIILTLVAQRIWNAAVYEGSSSCDSVFWPTLEGSP